MVLDFINADFVELQNNLSLDWCSLLSELGPSEAWDVFQSKVLEVINRIVPLKKVCRHNRPVWMSIDRFYRLLGKRGSCGDTLSRVGVLLILIGIRIINCSLRD